MYQILHTNDQTPQHLMSICNLHLLATNNLNIHTIYFKPSLPKLENKTLEGTVCVI